MSDNLSNTTRVRRVEAVFSAEIESELVVMHVPSGQYYGMDSIGAAVWRLLEQEIRLADLYASLAMQYDADIATIERDVRPWIERLTAENLVEIRN